MVNLIIILLGYIFINEGISLISTAQTYSNIYVSIGTSLIATGIVFFLDLWKRFSISGITSTINNVIVESGINRVYKKRDIDRYDDLVNNIKDGLDICGYSLGSFYDSFSEIILNKTQESNIKIRVIFVDPESDSAKLRAIIEGKDIELFKSRINTFIEFFKENQSIEIRKIDVPLSSMIFRIDNVMFIGPHFYKRQSKSTHTLELSNGHWLFEEYQEEFNKMWKDSINF